jgi:hypothetical protein
MNRSSRQDIHLLQDINEDNLNALNEEASQLINDEDDYEIENSNLDNEESYNPPEEQDYQEEKKVTMLTNHSSDYFTKTIKLLTEKNQEKDILITSLKKNLQLLKDKNSINSKAKMQVNIQNKQMEEMEIELNMLKMEFIKMQEALANKDEIINEFQNLSEISKNKFKMFEETNKQMKLENDHLQRSVNELQNKVIPQMSQNEKLKDGQIEDLRNTLIKMEKNIEENKTDVFRKEEHLKVKLEEKERILKNKTREREESIKNDYLKELSSLNITIQNIKCENEKLNSEIKKLRNDNEEVELSMNEKESEYKKHFEQKERELEKFKRQFKQTEKELSEFEAKLNEKQIEHASKMKLYEEKVSKLNILISEKDKKIKSLNEEIKSLNSIVADLKGTLKESEIKFENKDRIIDQLKNQNSEILKEFNRKESEIASFHEERIIEGNEYSDKIAKLENDRNILIEDNEELRNSLNQASDKLREMNDLIIDKYQKLELDYQKEKLNKENMEKRYKDIIKKMKVNEQEILNELGMMREAVEKKDNEYDNEKLKFENKIHKVSKCKF